MNRVLTLIGTAFFLNLAQAQQASADTAAQTTQAKATTLPSVADNNQGEPPAPSSNDDTAAFEEEPNMKLVTRAIYQCISHGSTVFADEENRYKYRDCQQLRAAHYEQIPEKPAQETHVNSQPFSTPSASSPCSGAIVYRGSTYIFTDQEPCPIPDAVFKARKPIEAHPEYYTQPKS